MQEGQKPHKWMKDPDQLKRWRGSAAAARAGKMENFTGAIRGGFEESEEDDSSFSEVVSLTGNNQIRGKEGGPITCWGGERKRFSVLFVKNQRTKTLIKEGKEKTANRKTRI